MRGLHRRVARLESVTTTHEAALVSPEALEKMASSYEAECARIREKLLGDGPLVPVPDRSGVDSEIRRRLREKLLRDDPPPAETAPA